MPTLAGELEAIRTGFDEFDLYVVLLSSIVIVAIYFLMERSLSDIKSKSWIVMLTSATVLSVFGCRVYYETELGSLWNLDQVYGEEIVHRYVALFFLASNVMDLILGIMYYPKYLDPLTTIFHHIFYFFFSLILIAHHYSRGVLLCFVMEVPTCFLAIGSIWKDLRSDALFGITFLLTRLIYNIYLAYNLYLITPDGVVWRVCCGVLCLHLFWFYKWIKGYGKKLISGKSSQKVA